MPQSKERHAMYVSLHRKVKKEHPEWNNNEINEEIKVLLSNLSKRNFTSSHKGFTGSQSQDSQVQNLKTEGSQETIKGSHKGFTGSQNSEKYLLSYSRNKYQFVLYSIDSSGKKALIRSCKKNDKLNLGPCEIELTWGPEEV